MSVSRFLFITAATIVVFSSPSFAVEPTVLGGGPKIQAPAETQAEATAAQEQDAVSEGKAALSNEPAKTDSATHSSGAAPGDAHAAAAAAHGAPAMATLPWSFDGIFGTYDRAAMQRGFQVYKEVCSACHSMDRLSYRNLAGLGYNEAEIKAIAADATITDGPNDEGDMYDRPGRPSDRFKSPYANVQQSKYANNGAYPADLSLIAKARRGGADYIHAILTGYEEAPANREILPGQYWNTAMNGNVLAMPPPLNAGRVTYGDGTEESVDQYAKDVAQFLTWAAEPHMEERKRTGIKVFLFLLIFTGVMYAVKRKVWSDIH